MGSYKSADLPALMREVDWTIVPSTWWENAPVVIQESFFHGRPIITSDIGGMAEKVRDGIDGLHFRAGNAESLAEAMAGAIRERALWDRLRSRDRAAGHRGRGRRGSTRSSSSGCWRGASSEPVRRAGQA